MRLKSKFRSAFSHTDTACISEKHDGQPSVHALDWHDINWEAAHITVRALQVRIAKAVKKRRWRQVMQLQRLLVRSFSAKALAVKRVTENRGKATVGVDGVTWSTPEAKWKAIFSLKRQGYRPKPLRRIYIPKSNGKKRPLGIPTMHDRAMQALYLLALEPVSESVADGASYGFRPLRNAHDALEHCFIALSRKSNAPWTLEGDIKGCFDNISHEWLLQHIPMDKGMLQRWLKAGYVEKHRLHATKSGTPQGGIISPVLANMALDGIEALLDKHFGRKTAPSRRALKLNFVRYADDFIITAQDKSVLVHQVKPLLAHFFAQRGLTLSAEKTVITHINEGFDFLGENVRKYNGKLLIKPSKSSVKSCLAKLKSILDNHKTAPTWWVIYKINPIIRGWSQYHRHHVAKQVFNSVDNAIFRMLWRWCCRRHPKQGKRWIKAKYFVAKNTRNWVFAGHDKQGKEHVLLKASDTKIQRYVKIRSEFNPYDAQFELYSEKRQALQWVAKASYRKRLTSIWRHQNQRCVMCQQALTTDTGFHLHHIVEKHKGGTDNLDNLVLLHPNCHRQLHAKGLELPAQT